jgi:D-3-phosphoglycerate dehydrogenase
MGVELVDLPTVMRESDYVCINTLLNEETKGLIGAKELALMKPTAFFIPMGQSRRPAVRDLHHGADLGGSVAGAGDGGVSAPAAENGGYGHVQPSPPR